MKKVEKLKLSMTMAVCFMVALFATSCSNDDFFGFNDDFSTNYDSDLMLNSEYYKDYLDWDYDGLLINATYDERQLFITAYERCQYILSSEGLLSTKVKNGAQINISEKLFYYISERVRESNVIFSNMKISKRVDRVKSRNVEQNDIIYNNLNCPCFALAYVKSIRNGVTYDAALRVAIDNTLRNTYGQLYDSGHLNLIHIPGAAQACGISGGLSMNNDILQLNVDINGIFAYYTGMENGEPIGHMQVIHRVERSGLFGNLYLYYSDPSYGSLNPVPIMINRRKFPIVMAGDSIDCVYQ